MDKPFFYNPFSAACQHDPRRLAFYREAPPVMPLFPLPGNSGTLYLALRLDAIDNVLRGEEFGVSPRDMRARRFGSFPLLDLLVKTMPFALEGAAHTQAHAVYLQMVKEGLGGRMRQVMTKQVAGEVARLKLACTTPELFDEGVRCGEIIDIAWLFNLWTTRLVLRMVGLPQEYAPRVIRWTRHIFAMADASATDQALSHAQEAAHAFWEELAPLATEISLREGICSSLFQSQELGTGLSDRQIATILTFVALASENPPGSAVALVRGLYAYPQQLQLLRANPSLLYQAVDETFRWHTNAGYIVREVLQPCDLVGTALQPGDSVACIIEAVHQDAELHPHPEAFLIERPGRVVRSFGGGAWACTGQRLAREIVALIGKQLLLEERPAMQFLGQEVYGDNSFFRSPIHLYAQCCFEGAEAGSTTMIEKGLPAR